MGKIYCIMGKSASGKDSVYKEILKRRPGLLTYVMYTTRPQRVGETDGVTYNFTDTGRLRELELAGRVIESRTYNTVHGPWVYATVDDGQIDLEKGSYLVPATLESYAGLKKYYGAEALIPICINVEDGERLLRAVKREMLEPSPRYTELCRRFIADAADFSEEKLQAAGIEKLYENDSFENCVEEILADIDRNEAK